MTHSPALRCMSYSYMHNSAIWSDALGPVPVVATIAILCVGLAMIFELIVLIKPVPALTNIFSIITHDGLGEDTGVY